MKKLDPLLSVIVPVFNEERRMFHLPEICDYFQKHLPRQHEIIIINDGSTDSTQKIINSYQKKYSFRVVSYSENRGKGYAVRQGMLQALGRQRLFLDLDLSVNPSTWELFKPLSSHSDVVIGVRRLPTSRIQVHQPWIRENMGRIFTWLSQTVLQTQVKDFTCGFKMFSQQSAQDIFSRSRIDRWGFDAEILYLARYLDYKIIQIPVVWRNDANTRVNLLRDSLTSLADLIRIRAYSFLGSYTRTLT